MEKEIVRTMFYRRVVWPDTNRTLEPFLHRAHENNPETRMRTFGHGENEIQSLFWDNLSEGIFVHVASYIPHQATSLVPFPSDTSINETKLAPPPNEHNYMRGDIFFLLSGNDMVLLPNGSREGVAVSYIKHMLRKNGQEKLVNQFDIQPAANIDTIRLLQNDQVKTISLNATMYDATAKYTGRKHKTKQQTIMGKAAENIIALFTDDEEGQKEIAEAENLSIKLLISFDSRKQGLDLSPNMQKAAKTILGDEEDGGFTIITKSGKRVTADNTRLNEKIKLSPLGNSIPREEAVNALSGYLHDLKNNGMLEQ